MKKVLAELNEVINILEDKGKTIEASMLNNVFIKIAQNQIAPSQISQNQQFHPYNKSSVPGSYVVRAGDTFGSVVSGLMTYYKSKGNSLFNEIKQLNPKLDVNFVVPGQTIKLPQPTPQDYAGMGGLKVPTMKEQIENQKKNLK
jgi:hypothetical protein